MRFTASNTPVVLAVLLGLTLSGVSARAQSSDAGPADPEAAQASTAPQAAPPAGEPAPNNSGFTKTLSPQQRLPENLQGWLRERSRRYPGAAERPSTLPHLAPQQAESPEQEQQTLEGYKRRLRSFDEGGVTVLSNRHAAPPPRPEPAAATPIAVAATVPAPRGEDAPEPERPSVTETRSLRAKQRVKAALPDQDLGWPAFAVPIAAIGLGLIWLRRRRQAGQ